jgi:riboflavin synthase
MFTGIIEELGDVAALDLGEQSARITVRGRRVTEDAVIGSSIAVNGVCLTVTDLRDGAFVADVMAETLRRTGLGALRLGAAVNLERPVIAGGRLGGHIVQGHVDGVGAVLERTAGPAWEVLRIGCPPGLARYLVEKGSVAVDGVSLTVASVSEASVNGDQVSGDAAEHWFTVSLIPQTLASTTLGTRAVGEQVNLEVDVLAKYVERLAVGAGR